VALFDSILSQILNQLRPVFAPFQKLFDLLFHFWQSATTLFEKVKNLTTSITEEVRGWQNFRENPSFKNRLVSIPSAYDKTKQLILQIPAAWRAILDLIQNVRSQVQQTGNPTEEAEQALKDIQQSGFKSILKQFPKFAKGLEKVLGFVAIIAGALESISAAVDDLQAIVDVLKGIREEIETQESIFLPQKNPRKIVQLKSGKKLKLRIGHLHSADV